MAMASTQLPPQSSQMPSSQPMSRIFVAHDNSSLPIFVEANGVKNNRPKLIRTLRNYGAEICHDVSRSRIILVDPNSEEGRAFVRDWGLDPGKVILDAIWAYRCIDAGRALLENDAWAGCGDLDGTPLSGDKQHVLSDDEDGAGAGPSKPKAAAKRAKPVVRTQTPLTYNSSGLPSSLPTPRQTPVGLPSSSSQAFVSRYFDEEHAPSQRSLVSQRLPTPPLTASSLVYSTTPAPFAPEPPQSQTQYFPPATQGNSAMQMPQYEMALARPQQFPGVPLTPQFMQTLMNNPELMTAAMGFMMQNMGQFGAAQAWPSQPPTPTQALLPQPNFAPPQTQSQSQMSMHPPSMYGQYDDGASFSHYHDNSPPPPAQRLQHSPTLSMSPLSTFTAVSERDSLSPPISIAEKSIFSQRGKKRSLDTNGAHEPSPKVARHRSNSPSVSSKRSEKKRSKAERLGVEMEPPKQYVAKKEKAIPTGLFTAKNGSPTQFFVQVEIRNRVQLISQIKKNGGKITADPALAKYIIMTPVHVSPALKRLFKDVNDLHRYALLPTFIEACLAEDAIVDDKEFRIDLEVASKQNSAKNTSLGRSSSIHSKPTPTREINDRDSSIPSTPKLEGASSTHEIRDRSPTPPSVVELLPGGRHAVSKAEILYIRRFAAHYFRKKLDASLYSLAQEIGARVDSHSTATWQGLIYSRKEEFEAIRDEVADEMHVKLDTNPQFIDVTDDNLQPEEVPASLPEKTKAPPTTTDEVNDVSRPLDIIGKNEPSEKDVAQDLDTITAYFADAPMLSDEDMWADLTGKSKCKTSPTWQDFYALRMEEVNRMLRKALHLPEPLGDDPDEESNVFFHIEVEKPDENIQLQYIDKEAEEHKSSTPTK